MSHEFFERLDQNFETHMRDEAEVQWAKQMCEADGLEFNPLMEFIPNREEANKDLKRLQIVHEMTKYLTLVSAKLDVHAFPPPERERLPRMSPMVYDWRLDIVHNGGCASWRIEYSITGPHAKLI